MGPDRLFHKKKGEIENECKRKKEWREHNERILIVCEGEKTEPMYFKGLIRTMKINKIHVEICENKKGHDPLWLVDYAIKEYKKGGHPSEYDDVYCVFDKDQHSSFNSAVQKAQGFKQDGGRSPVHAITSVPCFEVWFLLHFEYTTMPFTDADNVISQLKIHTPYEKKNIPDDLFREEQRTLAKQNVKKLIEYHRTSGTDNPSTGVLPLIEKLEFIQKQRAGN